MLHASSCVCFFFEGGVEIFFFIPHTSCSMILVSCADLCMTMHLKQLMSYPHLVGHLCLLELQFVTCS